MKPSRTLEQQVAVFGLAGSGKTVLLSSFYGATQEPEFLQRNRFNVVAEQIGQGSKLHKNYLGMRDAARVPMANRFSASSYAFSIKLQQDGGKAAKAKPFDALRLVWHDYPGEWFEQDVSGPQEAQRRVDGFKALLGSDVALLLVDGQKLMDHAGAEEPYLKSLLASFQNGLLSLRDDLLEDGQPLVEFPRIWVLALSKADLLPDLDVYAFRDLLIGKVADELDQLRKVLGGLVEASDALSVGEDFLLLSSAKFEADKIEVQQRVGVELVLPLAAMLPFERHVQWAQAKQIPGKVAQNLLGGAGKLAAAVLGAKKVPVPVGFLLQLISPKAVDEAVKLAGDKLKQVNADALAKHDHLRATLTRFQMDLEDGEKQRVLLRSLR